MLVSSSDLRLKLERMNNSSQSTDRMLLLLSGFIWATPWNEYSFSHGVAQMNPLSNPIICTIFQKQEIVS